MIATLIPSIGPMELVLVLLIVLVVFGASRLPELGKGLGEGIRNFRKGVKDAGDRGGPPASDDTGQPGG